MKPRCRPGDMALVIKGMNTGKIVHVVRAYQDGEFVSGTTWCSEGIIGGKWVVKSAGSLLKRTYSDGTPASDLPVIVLLDRILKPIRPGKGTDEVLRITGKPKATPVPVKEVTP